MVGSKLKNLYNKLLLDQRNYFVEKNLKGFLGTKFLKYIFYGTFTLSAIAFPSLPVSSLPQSTSSLISESPKEVIDQVWQIIYRDYLDSSGKYDSIKWLELRKKLLSVGYVDASESYDAIRGMLSSLEDPYTRFLDPREFKEMRIDTSGELTGVGIQLSLDKETNSLVVVSPIEGTPAFNAGIKPNDVIISINEESTQGMSIDNAVKLIRGKKGSEVVLGLKRNNKILKIELVRARIEINAVETKLNKTQSGLDIGYIRLKQFNANSVREMRNAISNLESENIYGYILDLRRNPGGLLEASIEISRLWIREGIIVSTETRDGIKDVRRANGSSLTKLPVVVLVDGGSASASEIVSGAIQDNNRGILVGQRTFGKGLVQSVRSLSDGSGLTVTIAKYLTPKGKDIHKYGIEPDIEYKLSEQEILELRREHLGTKKDPQYKVAESALLNKIKNSKKKTTYNPIGSNINYALE